MKTNKLLGLINVFAIITAAFKSSAKSSRVHSINGANRQRFNLGGLPPAWKGKRQARINRGGK